jgi:cellulose synthase (UDP-forming)
MGWQPTGGSARKSRTRRIWTGIALWNGTTSAAWVLLAFWRTVNESMNFVVLLAIGLMTLAITVMALFSRRNYEMLEGT